MKALVKSLKGKLGSGGAFKDGEIEIQGNMTDRVVDALVGLGYKNTKKSGGK